MSILNLGLQHNLPQDRAAARPIPSPTPRPNQPPPTTISTTQAPSRQVPTEICGQRDNLPAIGGWIADGEETSHGDWPWIAAVYLNGSKGFTFQCGGTLVSRRAVITAAHCVVTTRTREAAEIKVSLGRHRLNETDNAWSRPVPVRAVHVHEDYGKKAFSFDADLAILVLQEPVTFSQYIWPVCLWPAATDLKDVEGRTGTVVGWGRDENGQLLDVANQVEIPIVDNLACVQRSPTLIDNVSSRTFCAGSLDGSGPCRGDSGSFALFHLSSFI